MDESLSWRALLAKSNINILDVHDDCVFIEFTYHPKPGVFKWCKTYFVKSDIDTGEGEIAEMLLKKVLSLRKELEG